MAQTLFRVQMLALELGHTPTEAEMRERGITDSVLRARFGTHREAILAAGLKPNTQGGGNAIQPLPADFPSKEEIKRRWEAPMDWNPDYFKLKPEDAFSMRR